jgi:YgiT-type zinc finger domain-containing protein
MEQRQVSKMKTIITEIKVCPICGSAMGNETIDYIDKSGENYLIIRDVPVQECLENGHQFFHATIAKEIERLFELDRKHALRPQEVLSVPVVALEMA